MESQKQLSLERQRIFLSYAKEDEAKVRQFHRKLVNERLYPWLDLKDLLPGHDWDRTIVKAIRDSRFVIVFLSNHSVSKRGYVQKEIGEALDVAERMPEGALFIIPVRLEDCPVPERLGKWQWIDIYRPGGFKRLVNAIKADLGINDDVPSLTNQHPLKILSRDAINDLLLIDVIPLSGEFLSTRLPDGKVAISNGHFLEFRDKLPKSFNQLKRVFPSTKEFNLKTVNQILTAAGPYREGGKLLSYIRSLETEEYAYVLISQGGNRCGIMKDYMHYIQMKYPDGRIYLTDTNTAIVVEDTKEVKFIVMPCHIPSTVLASA